MLLKRPLRRRADRLTPMENDKQRVLLVDDQAIIRRLLRTYLETVRRCEVTEAENGLEAVNMLLSSRFDLLITDLMMPEMTGLELLYYVRNSPEVAALPVIMLTSQEDEPDRRKAAALGVNSYLVKPFNPLTMKEAVERCLPRPAHG